MNNKIISTLTILLFASMFSFILGQCPTNIDLESQQEVDDFATNFPGCVTQGWVTDIELTHDYGLDSIVDLSGLSSIVSVKDELRLTDTAIKDFSTWNTLDSIHYLYIDNSNDSLTNLTGLENLSYLHTFQSNAKLENIDAIEHLEVTNLNLLNSLITTIDGFNSATEMGQIQLINNNSLVSVTGFQSLTKLAHSLSIDRNELVADLSGFVNLESVGGGINLIDTQLSDLSDFASIKSMSYWYRLLNNNLITDISQLSQLQYADGIEIKNNDLLNDCCIVKTLKSSSIVNQITFANNNTNCNDLITVINLCLDSDNDGVLDTEDNCPDSKNIPQSDFDNDGVGDGCDNCPLTPNTNQADSNSNGIGDVCDMGQNYIGIRNDLGDIYVEDNVSGIILKSINGDCYRILINVEGQLESHLIECP